MNARQVRQLLTPLYEKIATTSPLDEFVLLAVFSEICEIRELAREAGFDASPIDQQLAKCAINKMTSEDYLAHHHQIQFYCPYLEIRPETFTAFKLSDRMADDYLYLAMKNVDKVDNSTELADVIFAGDKFYLSGHHDHFIKYMSYICESFSFTKSEVGEFFRRENTGSCASSLSNSLVIVHNIIKENPDFMEQKKEFWHDYTNFLSDYARSLGVKISARAEDIEKAISSVGNIAYGALTNYLILKTGSLDQSYNALINTDLKDHDAVYRGINHYSSGVDSVQLFIKLFLNGVENQYAMNAMLESYTARPDYFAKSSVLLISKEDIQNNEARFIALCELLKLKEHEESARQFTKILYRAGVNRELIIQGVGARSALEYDLDI